MLWPSFCYAWRALKRSSKPGRPLRRFSPRKKIELFSVTSSLLTVRLDSTVVFHKYTFVFMEAGQFRAARQATAWFSCAQLLKTHIGAYLLRRDQFDSVLEIHYRSLIWNDQFRFFGADSSCWKPCKFDRHFYFEFFSRTPAVFYASFRFSYVISFHWYDPKILRLIIKQKPHNFHFYHFVSFRGSKFFSSFAASGSRLYYFLAHSRSNIRNLSCN